MKLCKPNCPQCDKPAIGILESLLATAWIQPGGEPGEFDYAGESEVHWDTQAPDQDEDGIEVMCESRHHWRTELEE